MTIFLAAAAQQMPVFPASLQTLAATKGITVGIAETYVHMSSDAVLREIIAGQFGSMVNGTGWSWDVNDQHGYTGGRWTTGFAKANDQLSYMHQLIWGKQDGNVDAHAPPILFDRLAAAPSTWRAEMAARIQDVLTHSGLDEYAGSGTITVATDFSYIEAVNECLEPAHGFANGMRRPKTSSSDTEGDVWTKACADNSEDLRNFVGYAFERAYSHAPSMPLVLNEFWLEMDDAAHAARRTAMFNLFNWLINTYFPSVPISTPRLFLGVQAHLNCHLPYNSSAFKAWAESILALGVEGIVITELDCVTYLMSGTEYARANAAAAIVEQFVADCLDVGVKLVNCWSLIDNEAWQFTVPGRATNNFGTALYNPRNEGFRRTPQYGAIVRALQAYTPPPAEITVGTTGTATHQSTNANSYTFAAPTVDADHGLLLVAVWICAFADITADMSAPSLTFTLNGAAPDHVVMRFMDNVSASKYVQAVAGWWNEPTSGSFVFDPGFDNMTCGGLFFMNVSGIDPDDPLGAISQNHSVASFGSNVYNLATEAAGSLVIEIMGTRNGAQGPVTWSNGAFTRLAESAGASGTGNGSFGLGYLVAGAPGNVACGGSMSNATDRTSGAAFELRLET